MTQRGNERVAARQRARERRLKLDADRIDREARIDAAVGDYELVRVEVDAARAALASAEVALRRAVAAVLAEGEPVDRVAALCELSPADVRRLSKLAGDQPATAETLTGRPRAAATSPSAASTGAADSNESVPADVA
jgi:hypothetical protein